MIPSVSGGIGHISRTATLARALKRLDPAVEVEYVLVAERLRAFNVEATMQMGYRPRFLPPLTRDNRDAVARACLGDADVIVDDTQRYLVPLRASVPRAAWVSIPMHPLGDELFGDWPFLKQVDTVIWAYAPLVEKPAELELVADKVVQTGPFLELGAVPPRAEARRLLGMTETEGSVVYAPRGFPFGREFGHRVLVSAFEAVAELRRTTQPDLSLTLLAVSDPAELRGIPGFPDSPPPWVRVRGVLPQAQALMTMRAADALMAEGTSTMHEGAALRTPMVLTPGPIGETQNLARALARNHAAITFEGEKITAPNMARAFDDVLNRREDARIMAERALKLVTVGGGVDAAARLVLDVAARHRAAFDAAPRAVPGGTGAAATREPAMPAGAAVAGVGA